MVGGNDRLAVAVGVKDGPEFRAQRLTEFQVVVDLTVEHQDVTVRALGRSPTQRLVGMGDIDDRQPVETQHNCAWSRGPCGVSPGSRLVGASVAHQVRRAPHGADGLRGDRAGGVSYQGKQSAHSGKYARPAAIGRTGYYRIARCVRLLLFGGLRCVVFEWRCTPG